MASFSEDRAVASSYVEWDPNSETRDAIKQLMDIYPEKLKAHLGSRLVFGTAGLRAPMGPGYNKMNDLVILQTAQGLLKYIESQDSEAKHKVCLVLYVARSVSSQGARFCIAGYSNWI